MIKINGTEHIAFDRDLITGYIRVSAALVSAACDAFFLRRGMPLHDGVNYYTRRAIPEPVRRRASAERKRKGAHA